MLPWRLARLCSLFGDWNARVHPQTSREPKSSPRLPMITGIASCKRIEALLPRAGVAVIVPGVVLHGRHVRKRSWAPSLLSTTASVPLGCACVGSLGADPSILVALESAMPKSSSPTRPLAVEDLLVAVGVQEDVLLSMSSAAALAVSGLVLPWWVGEAEPVTKDLR